MTVTSVKAEVFDTNGNPSNVTAVKFLKNSRMERFAARKAIVAEFDSLGLLVEVKPHDLPFLMATAVVWLSNQC
ncbi:hypothetical protein ACLK1S_26565 [Escherichia coli]